MHEGAQMKEQEDARGCKGAKLGYLSNESGCGYLLLSWQPRVVNLVAQIGHTHFPYSCMYTDIGVGKGSLGLVSSQCYGGTHTHIVYRFILTFVMLKWFFSINVS